MAINKKFLGLIILGAFTITGTAQAATEAVYGNTSDGENEPGWLFNRDTGTQTPYEFTTDVSGIGEGSLFVLPIENDVNGNSDKFIGELFLLTPIADIDSISYDFQIHADGDSADKDHFYMSVYANFGESSPTKFYDCRYSVIPTSGSTGSFTTVTFDPTATYPVTTRGDSPHTCPGSPAGMDALSTTGSSTIRVIAINVGDTSANDAGVGGYLDNVVVALASGETVYDLEPDTTAPEIESHPDIEVTRDENGPRDVGFDAPEAEDDVDGEVNVVCDPASGSDFTEGTTVVTCTAEDAAGNEASTTFNVTVVLVENSGGGGGGGNRGRSAGAASDQAATATLNAGVVLPAPAATVIGEVLGAVTEAEKQAQIETLKSELVSVLQKMLAILQQQIAAAIAAQGNN